MYINLNLYGNYKSMKNLTIRQYCPSDIDQCKELWVELVEHHRTIYSDPTIGGEFPGHYFDKYLARVGTEHIWVAERDGNIVGLTGLVINDEEGEIDPVIVSLKHRGNGIGTSMVTFVIEKAQKLNLHYLSVKPVARNTDAINFYHHTGFRGIGQIELFMELKDSKPKKWIDGIELFGRSFIY